MCICGTRSSNPKKYRVFKARRADIDGGFFWVSGEDRHPVVKLTCNGKHCYLQCREIDGTINDHLLSDLIRRTIKNKEDSIVISEHYRDILGIKYNKSGEDKPEFSITVPVGWLAKIKYALLATKKHPDPYARYAFWLGLISVVFGYISLAVGAIALGSCIGSFVFSILICLAVLCALWCFRP